MPLDAGTRLGPYQIIGPLGAGGMGEVYRACDTRLDRTVAIKTLPSTVARDLERRGRFEREAKAIAALPHPHICTLHDVGEHDGVAYLVMELLDGRTLADRIASGRMEMAEALSCAIEIADALAAAHRHGIVHRDLKPANVMLTRSGTKLLDFGLAKLRMDEAVMVGAQTATSPLTTEGQILGTLNYMAPEQLEGKTVDARADIFAFGAIVFEMIAGRRAFDGSSPASVVGAILHSTPPPITQVATGAPVALERLLAVCLAKNPDDRWSSAHDVFIQLKAISASPDADRPAGSQRGRRREWLAWGIAAAFAGVALATIVSPGRRAPSDDEVQPDRLSILPPSETTLAYGEAPQISPDGRQVAFVATDRSGTTRVYVRSLDSLVARPLLETSGATQPFWSPDSRMLGFFADGRLKTVSLADGTSRSLASAPVPRGGTWNREGVILFSGFPNQPPRYVRVASGGDAPAPVDGPIVGFRSFPVFLPDGRRYLYLKLASQPGGARVAQDVWLASIDSPETTEIAQSRANVLYAAGHLFYRREGALVAQPFDPGTRQLTGTPTTIVDSIGFNAITYQALFSVSTSGAMTYVGSAPGAQLVWFGRDGKRLDAATPPGDYNGMCLTSDDARIVYELTDPASDNVDLWSLDMGTARPTRLTFHQAVDFYPVCSRTGDDIIFSSLRAGPPSFQRQTLAAPGSEKPLVEQGPTARIATDWSPDGRLLLYAVLNPATTWDVMILPLAGGEPQPFAATGASEANARFSPDGRWIAYTSNESGKGEVYVQPFPATGARWQVSRGGGSEPSWGSDGKHLYYLTPDKKLIEAGVSLGPGRLSIGESRSLMDTRVTGWERLGFGHHYVVTRDGKRILINTATDDVRSITLARNWMKESTR